VASEYVENGNEESECATTKPPAARCALCTLRVPEHFARLDLRQKLACRRGRHKYLELSHTSLWYHSIHCHIDSLQSHNHQGNNGDPCTGG